MIESYGFGTHILPRMLPALVFGTLVSLVWLVPLRSAGSSRWVLLAGVLVVTVAAWVTASLFVRRLPRFSRPVLVADLVVYAVMPVIVPLLQLVGELNLDWDAYPMPGAPGPVLIVYTAEPASPDDERLQLLTGLLDTPSRTATSTRPS